jgi:integrase/recombinase XerD
MKLSTAIQEYTIDRIANGYSQSTIDSYLSTLKIFSAYYHDPDVESITLTQLKVWFHYLHTEYKPRRANGNTDPLLSASMHGKWKAIRSLWNFLEAEYHLVNLAQQIPMPKFSSSPIEPFSQAEIKKLLAACDYTAPSNTEQRKSYRQVRPTALRDKTIILVLLDAGIRIGECSRIKMSDVDLKEGQIMIQPYGQGYKTEGRFVFLGENTRRSVLKYVTKYPHTGNCNLFMSSNTERLTVTGLKNLISHLGQRAGVHAHAHKFRHTFAIQYLRNGGDVFTLQRLLGHRSMEMVNRYLAIAQTDVAAAHRRASPVDCWNLYLVPPRSNSALPDFRKS